MKIPHSAKVAPATLRAVVDQYTETPEAVEQIKGALRRGMQAYLRGEQGLNFAMLFKTLGALTEKGLDVSLEDIALVRDVLQRLMENGPDEIEDSLPVKDFFDFLNEED